MSKNNVEVTKIAVADAEATIMNEAWSDTSKKIRGLASLGYTVSEIEKLLIKFNVQTKTGSAIRYQHVRNVLNTNLVTK